MKERELKVKEKLQNFDGNHTVYPTTAEVQMNTCDVCCFDSRQMGDFLLIGQMCVITHYMLLCACVFTFCWPIF